MAGDNGISINGAGGTKVHVDGRELKGSAEETTTYLRSLTAADIARIEVSRWPAPSSQPTRAAGRSSSRSGGAATAAWTATCNSPRCKAIG